MEKMGISISNINRSLRIIIRIEPIFSIYLVGENDERKIKKS